jgi:4-hydroxy-4-methyl-2-oxoglutarate aldolase
MTIPLEELCRRFRQLYLPAVCDAMYELGLAETVLPTTIRPLIEPSARMVGEAYTVQGAAIIPHIGWDEGIARMRSYLRMFEKLTPNTVIVSSTPPDSLVGHFGELTANAAKARGCVGVILDGNLRDIEGMRSIGFQVFYRNLSPLNGIGRWEMVGEQVPVKIGNVQINPGDIILAEFEAILVIPRSKAELVLVKAEEIVAAEKNVRDEAAAGIPPSDSLDRHGHI